MILQNSYNILWLDITSTQKQITKRWKDILKYLAIWESPDFENDLFFSKEYRNEIYVKEAIDNLTNPKNRLLNVFFWFDIDDERDKELFLLINEKDFNWAITLLESSSNTKNLIILYSLILLNKEINDIKLDNTSIELVEKLIIMFDDLLKDEKFWKVFEKKFYLYDDLSTDKKILNDFQLDIWTYLSDIFYDISKNLWDNNVLKVFNKYFKNTKWNKTNSEIDALYWELTKIVEKLERMDISEDWVFDEDEKQELKNTYKEIDNVLKKIKDIWLYDDSKTLLIRDNLVKALRVIMLDLSNNLNEDEEVIEVQKFALKIVWTDWLKHKIKEEYDIISQNIEFKPIIQLIDEAKHEQAYNKIEEFESKNNSIKKNNWLKSLKKQAIFWLLWEKFVEAKKLFDEENYDKARTKFNKVENIAKDNIELFEWINPEWLSNIINTIKEYLQKVEKWELDLKEVFNYIDKLREDILEKLSKEDSYYFIFYFDSLTYWYISEINIWNTKTDECYFCKKCKALEDRYIPVDMYKITKNFDILIYSNKKFKRIEVKVPICERCLEVREKNSSWSWKAFFSSFFCFIIFIILWWEEMVWLGCIIWIILFFIFKSNFKHEDTSRIINDNPNNYYLIEQMQSEWWKIWYEPQ